MPIKPIIPGVYAISLGPVNIFLLEHAGELTLIDTGYAKNTQEILEALQKIGKRATDIRHILVTHNHPDHAGGLAALQKLSGAPAYMHPLDAAAAREGKVPAHLKPAPGLLNKMLFSLFIGHKPAEYPAATVEHELHDGEILPIAGGLQALHVPGHCDGQMAFLWPQHEGVLFAGDIAGTLQGLGYSLGYKDLEEGKRSLAKIAALDFEVACFSHGEAISKGASARFRQKWGTEAV